ncbi:hypothetical protein D3C80_1969750 [compost metagenome]
MISCFVGSIHSGIVKLLPYIVGVNIKQRDIIGFISRGKIIRLPVITKLAEQRGVQIDNGTDVATLCSKPDTGCAAH